MESAKRLEIDLLKQSDSLIYFMWSATGRTYKLYRDGQLVYEGTSNSFKDVDLARGEIYTYLLEEIGEDGEVSERLAMQTMTENHGKNVIHCLQEIAVTAIVAKDRITLAWGEIKGIEKYKIYRDGELIHETHQTQFCDQRIERDKSYTYLIRGRRPLIRSDERMGAPKFVAAKAFAILKPDDTYVEPTDEDFWITKKIGEVNRLLAGNDKSGNEKPYFDWQFRYSTFLDEKYIHSPNPLSPNRYFAGDDRSFDPEAGSYRTRTGFSLQLTEGGTQFDHAKSIGTSIAYDRRKKFRKAQIASSAGIVIERAETDERKEVISINHRVGNPLTTSPEIGYRVSASFYRNGHYDISGIHDQSPNHEVYLKNSLTDEWMPIHQADSKGLAWMSDVIACQYWRISNFT